MTDKIVSIIGCGPGHKDFITQIGLKRIKESEVIIGSKRLLAIFQDAKAEQMEIGSDYQLLINKILNLQRKKSVILVSGDPGFFSLAKILIKKLGLENCEVIPGISSIQIAFARIGESWNDARFISLHGRDEKLNEVAQLIKHNAKVAVLTDDNNNPSKIAEFLVKSNIVDRYAYIFENLTSEDETIRKLDIESMCGVNVKGMNVVIFIK